MILPCIDLMGGKVVQLIQGKEKALEGAPPMEMVARFAGFPEIQVIDLDAAMGQGENDSLVRQLAGAARTRVGGGVRSAERAGILRDCGAYRIIVGTAAFTSSGINHELLSELAAAVSPSLLTIALDSKGGRIVVRGWKESTAFSSEEVLQELEPYCSGFLCTYVDKEGMMQGTDLDWYRRLRGKTGHELIAAGGITTIEEILELSSMSIHCALGMSIYTGRLDLVDLAKLNRSLLAQ